MHMQNLKFHQVPPIRSPDIERKRNFDNNQGHVLYICGNEVRITDKLKTVYLPLHSPPPSPPPPPPHAYTSYAGVWNYSVQYFRIFKGLLGFLKDY